MALTAAAAHGQESGSALQRHEQRRRAYDARAHTGVQQDAIWQSYGIIIIIIIIIIATCSKEKQRRPAKCSHKRMT